MKTLFAIFIALFGFTSVFSQANTQTNNDQVFTIVQTQPKFPGELKAYIANATQYPADAKKNNVQGTVYVSFIVEKDGSVSTVKILRGVSQSLDEEAIRVVSGMPKWAPGMQNGHAVRVQYTLPVRFVLNDNGTSGHTKN